MARFEVVTNRGTNIVRGSHCEQDGSGIRIIDANGGIVFSHIGGAVTVTKLDEVDGGASSESEEKSADNNGEE